MARTSRRTYLIMAAIFFALIAVIVFSSLSGGAVSRAATSAYPNSNAFADLCKDENFNPLDYPDNAKDYSIQVIQVAESTNGRLFVYTYQPSAKAKSLQATDINMSLSEDVSGAKLYGLVLVNVNGVFGKYQVADFELKTTSTRIYNVTSVYRAWDKDVDEGTGNNNTIDKKAFNVAKVFKIVTQSDGSLNYSVNQTQVIEIIDPYADYLIYSARSPSWDAAGLDFLSFSYKKYGYFDSHYVAFSTDWEIDRLLSATVSYYARSGEGGYNHSFWWDFNGKANYGQPVLEYAYPTYDDRVELEGNGAFGKKYTYAWDRIQTVAEFIATERNLTDETKNNLNGKQWVLRFTETQRTQTESGVEPFFTKYTSKFTKVDNVSVLRLEFEKDNVVYNLGAVSDTVSGDEHAGNAIQTGGSGCSVGGGCKGFSWGLLIALGVVLLVLFILRPILLIICPPVGAVLKAITDGIIAAVKFLLKLLWLCVKYLLIGLWWLVSLPFRLIAKAVKSRKDKPKSDSSTKTKKTKKTGKKSGK